MAAMDSDAASPDAPGLSFAFAAIAILVALLFAGGNGWAARRLGDDAARARRVGLGALAAMAVWMAVTGAAAASGVLARFDAHPPPLLGLFVGVFAISMATGLSRTGDRLARGLPLAALVGVQAFRVPLELVMHRAAQDGLMPVQMSFGGWNFDIVSGLTAACVGVLAAFGRAPRALLVAWNALGIVLLATIVAIALASTPKVHAFGTDPRALNTFVARFPFVWLPGVLVTCAIIGHIALTRRLLGDRRAARTG
jgi:hypothetical protein